MDCVADQSVAVVRSAVVVITVPRDPVGSSALQSPASRAWRARCRCQRASCVGFGGFFITFGHVWTVTKESW